MPVSSSSSNMLSEFSIASMRLAITAHSWRVCGQYSFDWTSSIGTVRRQPSPVSTRATKPPAIGLPL